MTSDRAADQEYRARIRSVNYEVFRANLNDYSSAHDRFRERVGTVSSVVFGLSLLALQMDSANYIELAVAAWILLGSATVLSVLGMLFHIGKHASKLMLSRNRWINEADDSTPIPIGNDSDSRVESVFQTIAMLALFGGVAALVAFAIANQHVLSASST